MAKRSYFSPHPSGTLGTLLGYWARNGLVTPEMQTRLNRLVKIGAIEVSPKLRQKWRMRQLMFEFDIETPDGWVSAHKWRYRLLQRKQRTLEPAKPMPPDVPRTVAAEIPSKDPPVVAKPVPIKDRAVAVALQMKRCGEIPDGISCSRLAGVLAERIGRPQSEGYIRKAMPEWGLWPIAKVRLPQ